ncbi:mitochondrial ATP synthase g subunit-domain-containing protein [Tuber borchii]|uniref:Mitochondrial ATP synthase g subunit-domain-containing protein n=1 Tax=Tuber borchii TaxID=42251 RepID=A0A2T6ZK58_TUBBO|nr:mitochondrial ATP synthase g subunit-domain-containing protein [Tuber borchii]
MQTSLLRSPTVRQLTFRRFASTTTESASQAASQTASKAQDAAKQTAAKAQEAAKVAASKLMSAASGLGNSLGKIGGRTGQLIKGVESLLPQTIYYTKVAGELSKLVFHGQKMSPPNVETFQKTFSPILNMLKHPRALIDSAWASPTLQPTYILTQLRQLTSKEYAQFSVLGAEVIGFYTIGKMIGRRKIVGYRGGNSDHH